jgi:hypothetical protein
MLVFWVFVLCKAAYSFFILRRDELAMLAKANEEQAAIGILPRRLRR